MKGSRFPGVLATEFRLHWRHGVVVGTVVMAVTWVLVLLALPPGWRGPSLPWLLFFEVTALGFFFVPALAVVERANGVTAALKLTRLAPETALAVRLAVLTIAALGVAAAVVAAAGVGFSAPVVVGVVLTTLLFSLLAVVVIGRADGLTPYIVRAPGVAIPLLTPALAHATGLLETPAMHLSPATGGFQLLAGRWSTASAVWLLLWVVAAWIVAVRIGFDVRPVEKGGSRRRRAGPTVTPHARKGHWTAVRSFAQADRRTMLSDNLVALLAAGILLIALALRWFAGPGTAWLNVRHGVDVTPHLPAISTFVLALHIPVMLGAIAGLLFLEDRDGGLFPVVATTRAGLSTLAFYRLVTTGFVVIVAVVGATLIAGVTHPAGTLGVIATALAGATIAALTAMILAAFAQDRVQGMALMKAITVPLYAPVAWWFVDSPAGWLFALVPTGWAARASWAPTATEAGTFAAGSAIISLSIVAFLHQRLIRRLVV